MTDVYETNDTIQFTFTSSVAPDSAPIFKVTGVAGTVIASITAQQSDTTHYYTLFTMPTSESELYLWEWFALKTVAGSAYNFVRRERFVVRQTRP